MPPHDYVPAKLVVEERCPCLRRGCHHAAACEGRPWWVPELRLLRGTRLVGILRAPKAAICDECKLLLARGYGWERSLLPLSAVEAFKLQHDADDHLVRFVPVRET